MIREQYMQTMMEGVPTQEDQLTVREGTAFFIQSLAHSQGNKDTQRLLFEYYKSCHPNLTVDLDTQLKIRESAWKAAEAHLKQRGHRQENLEEAETTFKRDFIEMFEILRSREPQPPVNISLLARKIIEGDLRFTGLLRSRKNRKESTNSVKGYRNDSQFSFIVEHAIHGADPGHPVFKKMYAEIGALLEQEGLGFPGLRSLILYYNSTHPDRPVWNVQPTPMERFKSWIQSIHKSGQRI